MAKTQQYCYAVSYFARDIFGRDGLEKPCHQAGFITIHDESEDVAKERAMRNAQTTVQQLYPAEKLFYGQDFHLIYLPNIVDNTVTP